jgi:16S rRNA (uracil1498-N3)-methyltransferase
MSLPRFHCSPIDPRPGGRAVLADAEARHARQILRMRPGDRAELFDGAGTEVIAEVVGPEAQTLVMRVLEARTASMELPIRIVLAPAVLKGDAMDALVRDGTMLGALAIAPVVTARTVVPARAGHAATVVERWGRIALASAKQCGRSVLPVIAPARSLDEALRDPTWARGTRLILCEPAGAPANATSRPGLEDDVVLLSGPEGGWAPEELASAVALGWRPWTCSPMTMRAETAPIAALAIVGWLRRR